MKIGLRHIKIHKKKQGKLTYHQIGTCQKLEVDNLDIGNLHLEQDSRKEEQIKVTDLLILPPTMSKEEKKP